MNLFIVHLIVLCFCGRLQGSNIPLHQDDTPINQPSDHCTNNNVHKLAEYDRKMLKYMLESQEVFNEIITEMRQAFFTQLDTAQDVSQTLKRLTAATQESNKMVKDLSQAFTTHLEEYKQEVKQLQHKVVTLEAGVQLKTEQLFMNQEIIQHLNNTIITQHNTINTQNNTINTQHNTINTQQALITDKEHTINTQNNTINTQHNTINTQQALITDKEHTINTQHNTINTQHNTINTQHNTINTQHNTIQNLEEQLQKIQTEPVRDCEDVYKAGGKESGVHTIYPKSSPAGMRVYCEVQEGQSWTVFLARHHQTPNENFTRSWQDYKKGFGDPEGEHWLGNENLHTLTGGETRYRLRVEATNLQGEQRYGEWRVFRVAPEDNRYRLTVEQYNSSSTLDDGLDYHNGHSFTTVDRDHDTWSAGNCAAYHGGSGWWWGGRWGCGYVNPTGPLHLSNLHQDPREVMSWLSFTPGGGRWVKLSSLTMKVIKS